ncbi:MAG: transposase, partial [Rhodobacteraceae bacterium]|nr:transposase [Paracoccaceae bacterium]
MTKTNMYLSELLAKHDQGDFLRSIAEAVLQLIMETDVEGIIGAGRHERSGERTTWRNGYRERALDTRLGTLNLRVPNLRQGSYFPGFLEARKTSEQALVAVIQEAWIGGVSTRRVDELVQAMGLNGISKSTVSKLCKDIDERVGEFLNRPPTGGLYPVGGCASRIARQPETIMTQIQLSDAQAVILSTACAREDG